MATIISSKTSGVGGLAVTGDSSGILQLASADGTTAVTIDASQNMGIGTTSPNSYGAGYTATTINNNTGAVFDLNIAGTRQGTMFALNDGSVSVGNITNNPLAFRTNNTERMRIDASGNVLVGTTASLYSIPQGVAMSGSTIGAIVVGHASGVSTGNGYINFNYNTGAIGSVTQSGTTAVLYNTTSDYRLKHDVTPIQNALTTVSALNPISFTWIDGRPDDGFLAHELQAVLPNCVTGEKDAVNEDGTPKYQQMDNSGVVPFLVKAIQELKAIIDQQSQMIATCTTRISALEAK